MKKIFVKNISKRPFRISLSQKLGHVVNIWYNTCFLTDAKSAFYSATVPSQTLPFFKKELSCTPTPIDPSMETKLDNKESVYSNKHAVTLLAELVAKYPSIWEFESFVRIPSKRWMKLPLKSG